MGLLLVATWGTLWQDAEPVILNSPLQKSLLVGSGLSLLLPTSCERVVEDVLESKPIGAGLGLLMPITSGGLTEDTELAVSFELVLLNENLFR